MGDIALRGNKLTAAKGGRARLWHGGPHNTGRTNLLEELGRVEGERSNPNRRAEISRVHGELNRGYAKGGRAGKAIGGILKVGKEAIKKIISRIKKKPETTWKELDIPGYPPIHKGKYPAIDNAMENVKKHGDIWGPGKAEGGRIGKKHGFQILGGGVKGKPHSTYEGRNEAGRRLFKRAIKKGLSKRPAGK